MVTLEYGFKAVRCPRRPGKWLATFSGPSIGTRYVRGTDNAAKVFDTEEEARNAGNAALIRALNERHQPMAAGTAYRVIPAPRSRAGARLVAEAMFRRGSARFAGGPSR